MWWWAQPLAQLLTLRGRQLQELLLALLVELDV